MQIENPLGCPDFASAIIETIDFLISLAFSFKKLISFIIFSSHFLTLLIINIKLDYHYLHYILS
ncbi:hypothetical protein [Fusobacterium vincentii ATCC 49256]|uniref:Uncharacterized protein n=1 Tax=Fusobacterium vincentii ATCC 49256 TaxID=209882 RepID=Q7P712_FUSVC|nr:hypothetical protein [Fusobacterium vincentii ATCC 49256]